MPVETHLWEIEERELKKTETTSLDQEELLQEWLRDEIEIIDADLLVIGEEVTTDLGDRLDLLAINPAGHIVVIELKRDRTPRNVVAQVLGYTAWASGLTYDEIDEITRDYLERDLADAFDEAFGEDLPERINEEQRMIVVAAGLDAHVERSLRYLSEEWGVDINAVFFRCFKGTDGAEYLVRSWLEEPSEVERRKKQSGRETAPTIAELREMAEANGAADQWDLMLQYADRWGLSPHRAPSKLSLHGSFPNGRNLKVFGLYPKQGKEGKLCVEFPPERMTEFFGVSEETLSASLPERHVQGRTRYLMSSSDIRQLAEALLDDESEA